MSTIPPPERRRHDTAVVVAHEIYGVNAHIRGVAAALQAYRCDVFTPSFLPSDTVYARAEEALAYREFRRDPGVRAMGGALARFAAGLRERHGGRGYRRVLCVGFSVGATAAWLASGTGALDRAVCFYGSRIRDHLDVEPAAPCLVVLAEHEPGFSGPALARALAGRRGVTTAVHPCRHGFCDPGSPAHSTEHAGRAWDSAVRFLDLEPSGAPSAEPVN
ncbi:dienelactone hydrolase family protein [Streptomyces cavernicola]|uniref:Dienelactone hydrolase family protein n=1 Tax=Streptomyces cavernicola TaxID=3043613 RepID=A0ABT6SAR9_9ACTN|nr:dienelactone hydrolase family protein [Streptomyces sp. B-S-A6]MDI3405291.1 dienelactone hydrolase family protein [Streptomyces sp. B-S-A6]